MTALILLAAWLPATAHCMLEAAGVLDLVAQSTDESGCCVDSEPCADDNCQIVEQGLRASTSPTFKAPATILMPVVEFPRASLVEDAGSQQLAATFGAAVERPLEWVPAWHFEHRTAHPPRAPSLISA